MTTFLDGPAMGQHLRLKRAPVFLRAAETGDPKQPWDALDQPEDEPRPNEKLHAYRVVGEINWCHMRMSGGKGGFFVVAKYEFIWPQPSDGDMRTNEAWQRWCKNSSKS